VLPGIKAFALLQVFARRIAIETRAGRTSFKFRHSSSVAGFVTCRFEYFRTTLRCRLVRSRLRVIF
jgi:hypothetical protein